MKAICDKKDIQDLLNLASSIFEAPVYLLNPEYEVLLSSNLQQYSINETNDEFENSLKRNEISKNILNKIDIKTKNNFYILKCESNNNYYYIIKIANKEKILAWVIIIINGLKFNQLDCNYLGNLLCHSLKEALLYQNSLYKIPEVDNLFIKDIIECKLTQLHEIKERAKLLKHPLKKFVSVIVIEFNNQNTRKLPIEYICRQLEQIFPQNTIATLDDQIVILYSYNERTFQIDVKQRKFYELLEFYDAYAGVSNGTRDYTKIRTMYLLAKSSVHLGRILRKDKNERIFAYEEVSMYCIIHLCVENFIKIYNHDDIIYLTHPAVVALTRHDVAYNDCLRDVLFYYLLNGRSIQKTANAMYMHRNTIQKKINKIEQIICKDLEDGHLQLRLLFSCLVMTYYEKYLQKELRL